ncbi:hypothetical protein BRPE64_ACDS06100 [Caballeronia insecticola]|uniref:Uncharacterized protein n=1 Tax=Caballeronia insecticola TaxID=758793 RepID=R4WFP7_9BURK|nr:hypothetical protein BRPE64_ACDS06100 [Caballeronia insecticola]
MARVSEAWRASLAAPASAALSWIGPAALIAGRDVDVSASSPE